MEDQGVTMTTQEMIAHLQALGYLIEAPQESIEDDAVDFREMLYENGEHFEVNPRDYAELVKRDREGWIIAITNLDLQRLFASWEDRTLLKVVLYGSDIPLVRGQRQKFIDAAQAELTKRMPFRIRRTNRMVED